MKVRIQNVLNLVFQGSIHRRESDHASENGMNFHHENDRGNDPHANDHVYHVMSCQV